MFTVTSNGVEVARTALLSAVSFAVATTYSFALVSVSGTESTPSFVIVDTVAGVFVVPSVYAV